MATAQGPSKTPTPDPEKGSPEAVPESKPGSAGFKGLHGFDNVSDTKESESSLLKRAQVKAPGLTAEFVAAYSLSPEVVAGIANGEIPPPPVIGPVHSTDLYLTPGGWQQTPVGVSPADVTPNMPDRRFGV